MRGSTLHGCVLVAARQLSQVSSLKGGDSLERPSSPKTLEAIDEYQRTFELTVDDRSELRVRVRKHRQSSSFILEKIGDQREVSQNYGNRYLTQELY